MSSTGDGILQRILSEFVVVRNSYSAPSEKCINCHSKLQNNRNILKNVFNYGQNSRRRSKPKMFDVPGITIYQALDLVFQITENQSLDEIQNCGLCDGCGQLFAPLFQFYLQFVSASTKGSFMRNTFQKSDPVQRHLVEYLNKMEPSAAAAEDDPLSTVASIDERPPTRNLAHPRKQQFPKVSDSEYPVVKLEIKVEPDVFIVSDSSSEDAHEDYDNFNIALSNSEECEASKSGHDGSIPQQHKSNSSPASKGSQRTPKTIGLVDVDRNPNSTSLSFRNSHESILIRRFKCTKCCERFAHRGNRNRHNISHVEGTKHLCSSCKCTYKTKALLMRHMFRAHPTAPIPGPGRTGTFSDYNCTLCDHKFLTMSPLKRHMISIHLTCPECKEEFYTKEEVNKHMDSHERGWLKPILSCDLCDYKTKKNVSFRQHKISVHSEDDGMFACNVCDKIFMHRFGFKRHMRTHNEERPFICDQCTMTFKHESNLGTHKLIHDGVKFICEICGHSSSSPANLRKHIAVVHHGKRQIQKKSTSGEAKKRYRIPVPNSKGQD